MPTPDTPALVHKSFKSDAPGFVHMRIGYLPQMVDRPLRSYPFLAIDRATRWMLSQIKNDKIAALAANQQDCRALQ